MVVRALPAPVGGLPESPRLSRRLPKLRGWSDRKAEQVLGGGPGACRSAGVRAAANTRVREVTITSIAAKIGCEPETLRKWVRQAQRDSGGRAGLTTSEREKLKQLEREVFELRRANEI